MKARQSQKDSAVCFCAVFLAVERGFDGKPAALEDVGVDHGGFDVVRCQN